MPSMFKMITVSHHIVAGCLWFFISNWKILTRVMDTQHNTGLPYSSRSTTKADKCLWVVHTVGQQRGIEPGATQTSGEKHYHSSDCQQPINLHISYLHIFHKEWRAKVGYQPQAAEQICQETFQDGGSPSVERSTNQRQLDSENRLLCSSHPSDISEPTQLPLGGQTLPIHMPTIWSLMCTESLH